MKSFEMIWRVVFTALFYSLTFLYFLWRFCIKVANWERDTNLATEQYCTAAEMFFVEVLGQSDTVTLYAIYCSYLYLAVAVFVCLGICISSENSYSVSLYLRQCLVQVGACVANPELNYGEIMLNLPRRPPPPACLHYTQCTNQPRVNVHSKSECTISYIQMVGRSNSAISLWQTNAWPALKKSWPVSLRMLTELCWISNCGVNYIPTQMKFHEMTEC